MAKAVRPPDVLIPTARTPGQFAGPGITGGVGRAAGELGRSIRGLTGPLLGLAAQEAQTQEIIAQIQDAGEEAQVSGLATAEQKDMEAYMDANGDHTTYEARWGEADVRIKKAIEGVTRKGTQDRLNNWYTRNSPIWSAPVTQRIQNGIEIKTKADTHTAADEIITSDYRNHAIAATGAAQRAAIAKGMSKEDAQNIVVTEREAKIAAITDLYDNANVNGGVWNEEEMRVIENRAIKAVDTYENTRHLAEESEPVFGAINASVGARSPEDAAAAFELARQLAKDADISEEDRRDLGIKINASENQYEQAFEEKTTALQTESQAKIASDIYANVSTAVEIDAAINAALLPNAEGVRGLTVGMAESLKKMNQRGDMITSDETNIEIDRLLRRVRRGELTYDDAITEYTTNIAKDVDPKEGEGNLDAISTAADSAKDPILNRPVVVRGQQVLDRIRGLAIKALGDEATLESIKILEGKILSRVTALDEWAVQNKDDPNFTEKFQAEVRRLSTPVIEEVTLDWFEKLIRPKGREEKKLVRKKIDKLEELDLWDTLSEQEKKDARAHFERGGTVQQIVELL